MKTYSEGSVRTQATRGRHYYQFYKGRDDFFRMVISFLSLGLEKREACLWIVSRSVGIPEAIHALQRACDLAPFLDRGQLLILPAEKWYLERSRFSERRVLQKIQKFLEDKGRLGFKTFRTVADLGWLAAEDWSPFQSYEEKAHRLIQDLRITAICCFPIQRCTVTQTRDVLLAHDGVFSSPL